MRILLRGYCEILPLFMENTVAIILISFDSKTDCTILEKNQDKSFLQIL